MVLGLLSSSTLQCVASLGEAMNEDGNKFVTVPVQAGLSISKLQLHF